VSGARRRGGAIGGAGVTRAARRGCSGLTVVLTIAAAAACGGSGGGGAAGTDGAQTAKPAAARPGITVVAERDLGPRLQEWTLRTPALDVETRVRVLLPAGYRAHAERRYPVLYLLHGRGGDYRDWTRYGAAERITARTPLIVVMPDAGRDAEYTDWYQGGAPILPRWETYHVRQLVPWVDARFRTIAARRGRAIAGLSMGGFGALSYAGRHPATYAATASFSGALEIGSDDAWGTRTAEPAQWRAHLPVDLAARLRSLTLVELRTGNGAPGPLDRPGTKRGCGACVTERVLLPMNVRMHDRLRALGIRHVWDDYGPGTHDWPYWRRDLRETLPDLMRALASR
jgi:diacylglycerol O-acyltransferase / trehalose O-mycolyltransferase